MPCLQIPGITHPGGSPQFITFCCILHRSSSTPDSRSTTPQIPVVPLTVYPQRMTWTIIKCECRSLYKLHACVQLIMLLQINDCRMTNTLLAQGVISLPFPSFAADVVAAASPSFLFPSCNSPMLVMMTINKSASCLPPSTLLHMRADPSLELELYM